MLKCKDLKTERAHINRKYKTLAHGSNKNGTVGVEYPNDGKDDSLVYAKANQ
jgi:hypothetical protein